MKKTAAQEKPAYQRPAIEELGNFAELTLGSKWQSFSDLSHGIGTAIGDGGPGS
ncbi:MAG: lasso RiPP family leader peptide-containing protein [Solirubrobacteraceae bacterium]